VQPGFVGIPSSPEPAQDNPAAGPFLPTPAPAFVSLPPRADGQRPSWQAHRLPPPTDLVITLQHFVI
jgi:hypothetical protein